MAQYLTFSNVFQYFGQIENGQYLTLENQSGHSWRATTNFTSWILDYSIAQFGALDEHGGWSPFPIGCQY
jgi:hypothetical protein